MRQIKWHSHAEQRLEERGIDIKLAQAALRNPDVIIPKGKMKIIHKRYYDSQRNKEYLLRIFVEVHNGDWIVRSVYRTSKIVKYREG